MSLRKNDIVVDEAEVIKLYRRDHMRRLKELASQFIEAPLENDAQGKVTDTVVSPGLKLRLKSDKESWQKGTMWVVVDAAGRSKSSCTPDQVMLTHATTDGRQEDMVIMKSELDDMFELM